MQGSERFRCSFSEDDNDQREQPGSNCHCGSTAEFARRERDQRRRRKVDEFVAQQDQADEAVRPFQQALGQACAAMPFARLVPELVAIEGHQGRFGPGEEGREQQQDGEQAEKAC